MTGRDGAGPSERWLTPGSVFSSSPSDASLLTASSCPESTDVETLSAWGERGVLVLLSDSTNVEHRGRTGCEDDVVPVGHGTAWTLLVAGLTGREPDLVRWESLGMPDVIEVPAVLR